jgi:tryptophan-rich sensory protein
MFLFKKCYQTIKRVRMNVEHPEKWTVFVCSRSYSFCIYLHQNSETNTLQRGLLTCFALASYLLTFIYVFSSYEKFKMVLVYQITTFIVKYTLTLKKSRKNIKSTVFFLHLRSAIIYYVGRKGEKMYFFFSVTSTSYRMKKERKKAPYSICKLVYSVS